MFVLLISWWIEIDFQVLSCYMLTLVVLKYECSKKYENQTNLNKLNPQDITNKRNKPKDLFLAQFSLENFCMLFAIVKFKIYWE